MKSIKKTWQKIGRIVYGVVGVTALISLIWAIVLMSKGTFFQTMRFFGTLGFFILVIGGINWGVKSIANKDIFLN